MITINNIKEYCIDIDIQNDIMPENHIRSFYDTCSLKRLLRTYSNYVGLHCYKKDNPNDYQHSYGLDILTLLEEIK